ncbi:MAG: hypothetical protein ACTHOE_02375 [Conexibacter sp.]
MLEPTNTRPSGSALSATGHRFGTRQLRELLAVRGEAGLWLAEDDEGETSLLRLYPGLPRLREWHELELAASWRRYASDARLIRITDVALDVWPRVTFACASAEPLARRIAHAPMTPAAAVAMCADVTDALAVLEGIGMAPVDIGPADIVLVGERARLLADVGLPGGQLAHACVDPDHLAPERAAALADRAQGVRAERPEPAHPTAESMTYALASIVSAALRGPQPDAAQTTLPAQLEQVLRRGLAARPSERYATPAALVAALGDAVGAPVRRSDARAPRATREPRRARTAVAGSETRPGRRGTAIAAVAVTLVAAAIGVAAGSASTPSDAPAAVTLVGAGLAVEAPQGWLRAGPGEAPAAVGAPALVAHPPRSPATQLVLTRTAAPLLARLADAAPEPVRLGAGNDAWRYRDVALAAGSVADVYVLEDRDGPIVAACVGPTGAAAGARAACAAALTTLRVRAGGVLPLGGEAAARRELARVVADLDQARKQARRALAAATTGRRQAAAADRLNAAYADAAQRARRIGTVGAPGELPRLADRLEETARAYAGLAAAARATHRTAYAHASERVAAQERGLQQDLVRLGSASPSG